MGEHCETSEDLFCVHRVSEIGEENLLVILKEVNNNMRTFCESIKSLYEPESYFLMA